MSISRRKSGFLEWSDKQGKGIGVESHRVDECIEHFLQHGFKGLFGSPHFNFDQEDLDFLARVTNARWLWFWDIKLKQIDAVYELQNLVHMGINPKRPGIDFSRFPKLKSVVNHWLKKDTGIQKSSIKEYFLWHFKPKTKSFEGLEIPRKVKYLEFNWVNPGSLDGLPEMKSLETLQIHCSRNMTDLSALPRIAPKLKTLLTTSSSKIAASEGVLNHPTLKLALIDGKPAVDVDEVCAGLGVTSSWFNQDFEPKLLKVLSIQTDLFALKERDPNSMVLSLLVDILGHLIAFCACITGGFRFAIFPNRYDW